MFNLYSPDFDRLGAGGGFASVQMSISWQDAGQLSLSVPKSGTDVGWWKNDNLIGVVVGNEEHMFRIVHVAEDATGRRLTVNARYGDTILRQRAVEARDIEDSTTAEDQVAGLIGGTDLPFTVERSSSTALGPFARDGGTVDSVALDILIAAGLGRRCVRRESQIAYIIDPGRDRTDSPEVPIFGRDSGHYLQASYSDDTSEEYNVAVATLVYADNRTETITEGDNSVSGIRRKEYQAGKLTQASGQSDGAFAASSRQTLRRILRDNARRVTLSAQVSPADYGTRYRVGDLIRVDDAHGGGARRIISAAWTWEGAKKTLALTLGAPANSVLKEIRRVQKTGGGHGSGRGTSEEERKYDYKELVARITNAEAGIRAEVSRQDEDNKFAQTQLRASINDVISSLDQYATIATVNGLATKEAVSQMYASIGETTAGIETRVTQVENDVQSLVTIKAQLISLQGSVSVDGGSFSVDRSIYSEKNIYADDGTVRGLYGNFSELRIGNMGSYQVFKPKSITSTAGVSYTVLAQ